METAQGTAGAVKCIRGKDMDRNSCYRILSLRSDATSKQIEKAYELRIARLKSADYADDPEYVQRKILEAKEAYKVLTGSEAPAMSLSSGVSGAKKSLKGSLREKLDKSQKSGKDKELREYEKSLEQRRSTHRVDRSREHVTEGNTKSGKRKVPKLTRRFDSSERLGEGSTKDSDSSFRSPSKAVIQTLTVVLGLITLIVGTFDSEPETAFHVENNIPEDVYVDDYTASESQAVMDRQYNRSAEYDFMSFLEEAETDYSDSIEWEISDKDYCHLYFRGEQLAEALGSSDFLGFLTYMTGDEDPFVANDDQYLVDLVATLMEPPLFDEVAGKISTFTGSPILTYDDYYGFLTDVAYAQTDEICDDLVFEY